MLCCIFRQLSLEALLVTQFQTSRVHVSMARITDGNCEHKVSDSFELDLYLKQLKNQKNWFVW